MMTKILFSLKGLVIVLLIVHVSVVTCDNNNSSNNNNLSTPNNNSSNNSNDNANSNNNNNNNLTLMKLTLTNSTMIPLSNIFSNFPVQATYPIMMESVNSSYTTNNTAIGIMKNNNPSNNDSNNTDNIRNANGFFRLLLPPRGWDITLCTPYEVMLNEYPTIASIEDSITSNSDSLLYPTALYLDTDVSNDCSLTTILSNVIHLNMQISYELEMIKYLVFTQQQSNSNATYLQIDSINQIPNVAWEFMTNNITIILVPSRFINGIMKMISREMSMNGCSPNLLDNDPNGNCNVSFQLNNTMDHAYNGNAYPKLIIYAYWNMFLATILCIGFAFSCMYHRNQIESEEQTDDNNTASQEKTTPIVLSKKQFQSLTQVKYTIDLVERLKQSHPNQDGANYSSLLDETSTRFPSSQQDEENDIEINQTVAKVVNNDHSKLDHVDHTENQSNDTEINQTMANVVHEAEKKLDRLDHTDSDVEALQTIGSPECKRSHEEHDTNVKNDNDYDYSEDNDDRLCCPICIEEFIVNETVIVLPKCNHVYHHHCIKEWLMNKQGCCPCCKMIVVIDDGDATKHDDNNNSDHNHQENSTDSDNYV